MGKLKPRWVKTDIPKSVKIKYLWKAMMEATTYDGWQQTMASMDWKEQDERYYKPSRDTYKRLKDEILQMPISEINTLPSDLKRWVLGVRETPIESKDISELDTSEGRPVGQNQEKAIAHDVRIFKESDDILNEADVRRIYYSLLSGNEVESDMTFKLGHFMSFFSYEGNQFLAAIIREKCEQFMKSLDKLDEFINEHFFTKEGNAAKLELWVSSSHRYKFEWEEETWREYHSLEPKLHRLASKMLKAYESYRATVRETLLT